MRKAGWSGNGIYTITLVSGKPLKVFCNLKTNNSWIVVQRRVNATTNFRRNWEEYRQGFGDLTGNYWIGLDNLNELAGPGKAAKLRVDLKSSLIAGDFHAEYSTFNVASAADKYRLTAAGYSGTAGDSMGVCDGKHPPAVNTGMQFSTYDSDNDKSGYHCAEYSGWWYKDCLLSDLNALYYDPNVLEYKRISWFTLSNAYGGVTYTEMKIRYG